MNFLSQKKYIKIHEAYLVLNRSNAAIPKKYILELCCFFKASKTYLKAIPNAIYLETNQTV